jgi:hypothetical protein
VDNSVDEICMDPIHPPVSTLLPLWSFFVHINKKPAKQRFAYKMRMPAKKPDQVGDQGFPLCISRQSKRHNRRIPGVQSE